MTRILLAGLGTAVPPHSVSQDVAAERVKAFCGIDDDRLRLIPALYRRAGVATRHLALLDEPTPDEPARQSFYAPSRDGSDRGPTIAERMARYEAEAAGLAEHSCRAALADAAADPCEITHVVTASCSGFAAPGFDLALFERLGLSGDVARTHVGFMGCHAALNALRVARAFAAADERACVLVCATELCSLHHQYGWDPEKIVANSLFADGSAAAVIRASEGIDGRASLLASGSTLIPDTANHMTWRIGDHGFEMTLSPKVPDVIRTGLRPWLATWLERSGLAITDVGSWAIHPGGPKIVTATGEALGLLPDALAPSRAILSRYGNMSSPTVLFILDRLRASPRPWVALAFGPGLVVEAALFA